MKMVERPAGLQTHFKPLPKPKGAVSQVAVHCPACGCVEEMKRVRRGSDFIAFVLFMCGIVPGILYVAWGMGWESRCPRCNAKIADLGQGAWRTVDNPNGDPMVERQAEAINRRK